MIYRLFGVGFLLFTVVYIYVRLRLFSKTEPFLNMTICNSSVRCWKVYIMDFSFIADLCV